MANKKFIALVFILATLMSLQSTIAFASPGNNANRQQNQNTNQQQTGEKDPFSLNLPDPDLFKPDLDTGGAGAQGIINMINIIMGIAGVVVLGLFGPALLKDIIPLIRGQKTIGQMSARLITLGVAIGALLLSITGAWVPILYFLWDTILVRMIRALIGNRS